jgi:hypothetical protein
LTNWTIWTNWTAALTWASVAITSEFVLSQESLDAMIANPAAAVSGLTNGIADGLGVESSAVEITRTVPDLLGSRRLAEKRRLEANLTVDFDGAVADSAVSARVDSLTSGDSSMVASLTSEVENGLAAQNFEVTIVSVASSAVAATTAAPTAAANGTGAGLSSGGQSPAPTPAPTSSAELGVKPPAPKSDGGQVITDSRVALVALAGVLIRYAV